jgi:hypothetical protein
MTPAADRLIGFWLGFALLLQALLLAAEAPMSRSQLMQFLLGTVCLTLLVVYLWRVRLYLNSHADMLLIMFTSGGLGMLAGMSSHMSPASDFIVWCRMYLGMFVLGLAPAIAFSRCLLAARRRGYLLRAVLIDSSAMLAGMWLSTCLRFGHGEWMMMSRHFTMLAGMMLGMAAGMWVRSRVQHERFARSQDGTEHTGSNFKQTHNRSTPYRSTP